MMVRLLFFLLTGGCLLFGAILFAELYPAGADDPAIAEAAPRRELAPAIRRQQNPKPEELVSAILARPLFSSTRRPPQSVPETGSGTGDLTDARLTGIVTTPGRRFAIFAISNEKPLKAAEGDDVSGWHIESITPREVSLSGPAGTKTLQPKSDPTLVPPPAAQAPVAPARAAARFPAPQPPAIGQPPATPGAAANARAGFNAPPRPRPRQQR